MNTVLKTGGKFVLVQDAAQVARESSTLDQALLEKSLEESELRQLVRRILYRLEALEMR